MKARELAEILLRSPEAELIFGTSDAIYYEDPEVVGPVDDDNSEERESARHQGRPVRQLLYIELREEG